ncbi:MAG: glycosyltransferase family 4 protein [Faecalicatena sp.]|uniref:glycosyltransferase family 4 protein n=1 Tax=Faecalicatena sp. TaxID=2005360 RepID=UPI00258587B4|nr:glycosyltransferase family 4 protein [Faecalicatena sp.]MCI6465886.1 glycosyltransferase family 4 protein [Faecalicatena sp.]MDY5618698.1 glycosyltransferase family 4 protein [Lachnospiraceae bacterium]
MAKKYCFFTANYLPHLGGVEIYTKYIAKALVNSGAEVTIVTSGESKKVEREEDEGIKMIKVPSIQLCNGRLPIIRYQHSFRKFDAFIKQCNYDLVVVQTRYYPLSLYGAAYARKKGIPCILLDHSTAHIDFGSVLINIGFEVYEHFMTAFLKKAKCDFYGVSQACSRWLEHFHVHAKGVLYNSVDGGIAKKAVSKDVYQKYQIPENSRIILYAGRLIREKGIEKLVKAVLQLCDRYPDLCLAVAGDGDLYGQLSKSTEGNGHFKWLGKLCHEDIFDLMKISSIFCLPTDYPEGFPTSVLEAGLCKCYVITTTAGGSKELITGSEYGTIMEQGLSEDALKDRIQYILDHPEEQKNAVENCYNRVMEQFTWEKRAEELERIVRTKEGC